MDTQKSMNQAIPTPPLAELMKMADVVVVGTVESSNADACWVSVESVIKGAGCGSRILLRPTGWRTGVRGGFVLSGPEPFTDLTGESPDVLLRRLLRLSAGLSEIEPPMSPEQIVALSHEADAVALVRFVGLSDQEAEATVVQCHRGALPGKIRLIRGVVDEEQPGGPWRFGAGQEGFATVFLDRHADVWTVLNDRDPRLCRLDQVVAAEAKAAESGQV